MTAQAAQTHALQFTPTEGVYARDLSLSRVAPDVTVGAWVADDRRASRIAVRALRDGQPGPIAYLPALWGEPAFPQACAGHLFWLEFRDARGRVAWARLDDNLRPVGSATLLAETDNGNAGALACCSDPSGDPWLLVEACKPEPHLLLLKPGGAAPVDPLPALANDVFRARPKLVVGAGTVMASWDEVVGDTYRVMAMDLCAPTPTPHPLPCPDGHRETFSALACTDGGEWFAARCRERLVEIQDGIAGYHSEIVVAVLAEGSWRDVATVDIDHGLNPWMAGYTGARRFPHLAAGSDHALLCWEEKEDSTTMDPAPARFCAARIGADGMAGTPWIAATDASLLVSENGGRADGAWLASKTQTYHNEQHLPWYLHRVAIDLPGPPRPDDLDSNRDAPRFYPRSPETERPVMEAEGYQLFFGDIHLHSRLSADLDGEQDELYQLARDVARVDFCAFTENDFHRLIEPMSGAIWEQNRRNAELFNEPGRFTVLLGWEYTKHAEPDMNDPVPNSHRCVLLPGSDGTIYHNWDDHVQTRRPADLCEKLRGQRALLHHHHPAGYDFTDDSLERNVEICSGWWNCMEVPGFADRIHETLNSGFRLGFFAGSDNHMRTPGLNGALAGVWATDNTREAIFDALWNRRVFATSGLRPDTRFRACGTFMGGEAETDDDPLIELSVVSNDPMAKIEIVRDGHVVHTRGVHETEANIAWTDTTCAPGQHYYYAHIVWEGQENNPYWNLSNAYGVNAWTSPVWVRKNWSN